MDGHVSMFGCFLTLASSPALVLVLHHYQQGDNRASITILIVQEHEFENLVSFNTKSNQGLTS